ncbi:hypothetical protein [Nonomuraea dietziae]|uniref:hypothetical protein n=1 Tax=Nonomuraea dietziae TaxID=65515 RepID=UPI00343EC6E8
MSPLVDLPVPAPADIGYATGTWDELSGGSSAKQRLADEFHAPPGFGDPARSQDGDGKVHLSCFYNGCSGECTAKRWNEAVDGTMAGIQAIQGVRSIT